MTNMVYVAMDPDQPEAAYAICADGPKWKDETAKSVARWIKDGASVRHVPHEEGIALLMRWVRPAKPQEDLF